ncbi:hypothetical protein [Candidatus Vidania fulgoroideorum]
MNIKPINNWIFLKKIKKNSVIISKKKESNIGVVKSLCKKLKKQIKINDKVIYKKFSSQNFKKKGIFVNFKNVIAIIK